MRRVFSGLAIAGAVAKRFGRVAADACRGHCAAVDERRGPARRIAAHLGAAGLCRGRIICVAGAVSAAALAVRAPLAE